MQHGFAAGSARLRTHFNNLKEFMTFMTSLAMLNRAAAIRGTLTHTPAPDLTERPYAFLSAHDLRGLVAAMVD